MKAVDFMNNSQKVVIAIVSLSLLIHVIYVLIAPQIDPVIANEPLYGDAYGYNVLANNLLSGKIFSWDGVISTSYRAPGYPAFLAAIYVITGENLAVVRLVQALLGACISVPVFWMGNRLAGLPLAIVASLGTVFHPLLLYMTAWLYTETLFIFLLWLGLWFLFCIVQTNNNRYIWLAGIILGITTLIRPQFIVLPLGCLILGFLARWNRRTISSFALVQLILLLVILPWTIRNYFVHQEFVLISTDTGPNLYGANNPTSDGGFASQNWSLPGLTEVESDKEFTRRALTWITQNPNQFIALMPAKLAKFYSPFETTTTRRSLGRIETIANLIYGVFLVLAFIGGIWLVINRKGQESLVIVALIIYATMITLIFHGGARLALPTAPALILFAGYALVQGVSLIYRFYSRENFLKIS